MRCFKFIEFQAYFKERILNKFLKDVIFKR